MASGLATEIFNPSTGISGTSGVDVGNGHVRTGLGEGDGEGLPNARAAASDQRLAVEEGEAVEDAHLFLAIRARRYRADGVSLIPECFSIPSSFQTIPKPGWSEMVKKPSSSREKGALTRSSM